MKVIVDMSQCDGNGLCVDACPEVFYLGGDDDRVTVVDDEPGEELREQVNHAVRSCPKSAIRLVG